MKDNLTSINVVLDKSGSMHSIQSDTIGNFNKFLSEQKEVPGEVLFSLCAFNHDYSMVYDFVKLNDINELTAKTYSPSGNTALLDAVGHTVDYVGRKLAALAEEERPSKVLFLIITDGMENASTKFKKEQIKEMIKHQTDAYNWEFVFMGANIDSAQEGGSLAVAARNICDFSADSVGVEKLYSDVSKGVTTYRKSASNKGNFFNNK